MNWSQFTTRTLLLLTLAVALTVFLWPKPDPNAPDPQWRATYFANTQPLANVPDVSAVSHQDDQATVTVTNIGTTTLEYRGRPPQGILLFQEVLRGKQWRMDVVEAEGMCEVLHELAPGESVDLNFSILDDSLSVPIRSLGRFTEKGTERTGLVVLVSEEGYDQ